MPLVSGKNYVFYNKEAGTALDLDTGSNTVQGWTYHGGENQQWKVTSHLGEGGQYWTIQNVQKNNYLAYQLPAHDGKRVICTPQHAEWKFSQESGTEVYSINPLFSPKHCVDLAGGGKSADGTPVQLWTSWGGDNQKWAAHGV